MSDRLSEFYDGKSILITGAAGYLGSVLLEILLRCFPGIIRIYVLLRAKKGVDPRARKELIFKKRIFNEFMKTSPNLTDKVTVVPGDISLPNIGISEEDMQKIQDEVSIVFHCAAMISFFKSFRTTSICNSKGVYTIIQLCRKLKKCDVLIYTSSAYANCHIMPNKIEEKIYKLRHSAQRFLDEIEHGDEESFSKLISECNYTWPNSYTFSKCLAENILEEKAKDLPVVVVRPSIIFSSMQGPNPGYVEDGNGIVDFSCAVGKGFVKIVRCNPDCIFDVIPVDIVANVHVISAWYSGTKRSPSPFVVHCASGDVLKLKFSKYISDMFDLSSTFLLPNSFQSQSIKLVTSRHSYVLQTAYQHHLPAFMLDIYLAFQGSKLRMRKKYQLYDSMMTVLYYFMSNTFNFKTGNIKVMEKQLLPEENKMIYSDISKLKFRDIAFSLSSGSDIFDWKFDRLPKKKREQLVLKRTMIMNSIKRGSLFVILCLMYLIISRMFYYLK